MWLEKIIKIKKMCERRMVMKFVKRKQVKKINLPGRIIQKVIGEDSFIKSDKMTMGFAYYSTESGVMQPHHHAEETVYIITAKKKLGSV